MSLIVVSTPIGNDGDITLRAIETLKSADSIICEELKPARILLKRLSIVEKGLFQLNEHSRPQDLDELLKLCRSQKVALISDCGTPGFFDPGADLVNACYRHGIDVGVNPGPSSLMTLLSLSGLQLKEFYVVGFLPAEKQLRQKKISQLKNLKSPMVFLDTPYRLNATVKQLSVEFPKANGVLGLGLTGAHHSVLRGKLTELSAQQLPKVPFVLIVTP